MPPIRMKGDGRKAKDPKKTLARLLSYMTQRVIDINEHFCKNGPEIPVRYENYGASKLAIMATFKNGLEKKLNPSVTVRQLEKLKKYYSKHGWNVNLNTKWTDDLSQFDEEVRQERLLKSKRLKEVKFVSAKEEAVASIKKVGKPYKAFTKFYDELCYKNSSQSRLCTNC